MTAAVVDMPRPGLAAHELTTAIRQRANNPDTAAYWGGYIIGFCATLTDDDVFKDALTDARRVMFAAAYTVEDATARLSLLPRLTTERRDAILKASGIRMGWKQGTSEWDDVEECVVCEERITSADTESERCCVGWFCNDACHHTFDAFRCCREEGPL